MGLYYCHECDNYFCHDEVPCYEDPKRKYELICEHCYDKQVDDSEPNICSCGKNKAQEPHICPCRSDVNNDDTLCTCCEDCEKSCAWDI
jgi:hypothetical protein